MFDKRTSQGTGGPDNKRMEIIRDQHHMPLDLGLLSASVF